MKTITFTALLTLVLTLSACRTARLAALPEPSLQHELRHLQRHTDTLILRDSIYVERSGDTLRIEKYITRWRDRRHTDSIYITDTLRIPYPVERTVTARRPLSRWQRFVQAVGTLTLAAAAAYLLLRLRR